MTCKINNIIFVDVVLIRPIRPRQDRKQIEWTDTSGQKRQSDMGGIVSKSLINKGREIFWQDKLDMRPRTRASVDQDIGPNKYAYSPLEAVVKQYLYLFAFDCTVIVCMQYHSPQIYLITYQHLTQTTLTHQPHEHKLIRALIKPNCS